MRGAKILIFFFSLPMFQSSEESCWLYEDDEGRKRGPHSLLELYSWHQCGYLQDSLLVSCTIITSWEDDLMQSNCCYMQKML